MDEQRTFNKKAHKMMSLQYEFSCRVSAIAHLKWKHFQLDSTVKVPECKTKFKTVNISQDVYNMVKKYALRFKLSKNSYILNSKIEMVILLKMLIKELG